MTATQCTNGENNLHCIKWRFKMEIYLSNLDRGLVGVRRTALSIPQLNCWSSWIYKEWSQKEEISSEWLTGSVLKTQQHLLAEKTLAFKTFESSTVTSSWHKNLNMHLKQQLKKGWYHSVPLWLFSSKIFISVVSKLSWCNPVMSCWSLSLELPTNQLVLLFIEQVVPNHLPDPYEPWRLRRLHFALHHDCIRLKQGVTSSTRRSAG